ncbi:cardiac-enriched FHL2-interacting protein [Cottoperca gobio]|uniref:Cardiac-enriched FHL2-interacting protein n=1 Tax=Cottoperca gobio TaxID=56716 RepID=A0A6J2R7J9_COTGO|nr:cardiac-enriched FHL2-interacting protein [Cottoperca gobio]XP_029306255.1 cardiac-enriched FHL2-interacting protein [Cottoperca gobio]
MTSVEKRRSGRKSGGHRKHSDGGYSDTSSGGSFLDETDREVSNLTDRAFRSLCIGDEAVYNDSDLCSSSPCTQRDRQLAFNQSGQDREDREREELKRAAHESFSVRMEQYGQDWIHGGMYGAEIQRDPQWEVYGERTPGRVSATFQHSFVETSQQGESLGEEQLSFLSNGATEFNSQQRRSRSRVSSLIRAFNSEGQRDGTGTDGKLREWNDETSWDKSALMSIQRELSEFSTSYQQNFDSGQFPLAGSFSSRDTNLYSSKVAAVSHMNSESSFMRSSHSKHSMSTEVNSNSNFFIHSEFSPFKVWRDHNRFPFQQGEVSGFMHCSEFPKWYETPMYRELSLEAQPHGPYRFEERGIRQPRNNSAPFVPPNLPRSTSTSTLLQKACAVETRCESELTGHYPHRKRTQSLGANRLPSQRPSTASPTSDMSRRVQDTISSVKALQQKIKMMTEQNIATGMTANQQGGLCSNDNVIPIGYNTTVAPNVVSNNTSTTPFNISQLLTPLVHAHQEAETSEVQQYAVSPQPVEHAPVRAESRGATPVIGMSSYKSRATSLLFNLKDNRKRVKSTYSPTKFKGLETLEKNKQPSLQEPRDTVIDIPNFPDPDVQFLQVEESNRTNAASYQYANQYHSPGLSLTTPNSQPAHTGQYSDYTLSEYQTAQMQSEMVHHSGLTGFIPESYASNQPANGQNLYEDLSSFAPYQQGMIDNVETLGGDVYRLNPSYRATETPKLNADNNQHREYSISKADAEQHFNETVGREFTKVDRYQQLKDNKHDYSNVSSQDRWRPTNSQDTEHLKAVSPWKQEITALIEKDQHAYQREATITEELNSPTDKYRGQNQQSINKELDKIELRENFVVGTSSQKRAELVNPNISNRLPQNAPFSNDTIENPAYYGHQQPGAFIDKYALQKYYNEENEMKDNYLTQNYNKCADQEYRNQHTLYSNKDKSMLTQETAQRKQYMPIPKVYEMQSLQPIETKPQLNMQKHSLSNPGNALAPTKVNQVEDRQFVKVEPEQAIAEHNKAKQAQAELAKAQHWAQVEQHKAESARLILAGQTGSEKVKAEEAKAELTEHERVNQVKAEHIKKEKRKEEQSREIQPESAKEEQTKTEQIKAHKVTEGPTNITEEVGAEHLRQEQGEQVKVKQAEAERLKEEYIMTELANAEETRQARLEQPKTEQARKENIHTEQIVEEQVRADRVEREQMEAEQIRTEKLKPNKLKQSVEKQNKQN